MKQVFLAVLAVLCIVGTSNATTLTTNMTVDNGFIYYVSTDDTTPGVQVGSGNSWPTTYNFDYELTEDTSYYIHVAAQDWGVVGGFLGEFTLSDSEYEFANGTQSLLTNTTDWSVRSDSFGGTEGVATDVWYNYPDYFPNIDDEAEWIWTNGGTDLNTYRFFSAEIISQAAPVPEPATMFLMGIGLLGLVGVNRRKK